MKLKVYNKFVYEIAIEFCYKCSILNQYIIPLSEFQRYVNSKYPGWFNSLGLKDFDKRLGNLSKIDVSRFTNKPEVVLVLNYDNIPNIFRTNFK